MCEKLLYFNWTTLPYTATKEVTLDPLTNSVTVKNLGTSNVVLQGEDILPGDFKVIGGNRLEVIKGRVDISFTGAGTNLAIVTLKYYLPGQGIE